MKRLAAIAALAVLCLTLSGCRFFTVDTEELMFPPEISGDMYPISKALSKSVKGEYRLKYPSSGDQRSAIVLEDLDGDGTREAFAFYSTADDEMTNMHINAICEQGDGYTSVGDQSIVAGGVERVDFCDLNGDGTKEILVGWEVYGLSEKQLCVYALDDGTFSQLISEKYSGYICCDLSGNGKNELLVHLLNTVDAVNTASLYSFSKNTPAKIGSCVLDGTVKTVSNPVLSTLSTGQTAVYLDEIKGAGAVTEVLFYDGGELKNPLLDTENTYESNRTLRAASINCRDIDGDGVLEIPVATALPNAAGTEELLYYTNWCAFDGQKLATRRITVVNSVDGYYLEIPDNLANRLAVIKDTDNHRRVFYYYDKETETVGSRIATVAVVSAEDFDSTEDKSGVFELGRSGKSVFVGSVGTAAKVTVDEAQLKDMFKINTPEVKR